MSDLTKTVTVQIKVDPRVADLVYFVKRMSALYGDTFVKFTDEQLVNAAEDFWDTQHGEE